MTNYTNFYNDVDKMLDFIHLSKEEFLNSYSYLTETEYHMTQNAVVLGGGLGSYALSKHILDLLNQENHMIFRMAISHLMDVGIRHLTLEDVEAACDEINKKDDSHSIITNNALCQVVETAGKIARLDHIHVLTYISREIYYDVGDDKLTYHQWEDIAKEFINHALYENTSKTDYEVLSEDLDFDDDMIIAMGYGRLIPDEE